jgi:hypothetical protein
MYGSGHIFGTLAAQALCPYDWKRTARMSTAYAARRPVVLIVEDDLLIRLQAVQIISEAEFDVLEASSADEAISILEARSDITVLFTDIQMPGGCGQRALASDQNRRDFRPCRCANRRLAGRRALYSEALRSYSTNRDAP